MKRIYTISREALNKKNFSEVKKATSGVKNENRDVDLIVKILKKLT